MKKTSIKELRSFSKAELIRYVQYVEGEPLRAHHTAARTYIYELRLERVNKRYDAAVKKLSSEQIELLDMYVFDSLSQTDIARRLGVNQSSVSRQLNKIKEILIDFDFYA